jgi:RNA polymerase sigma-70 factor, ECF subfamily
MKLNTHQSNTPLDRKAFEKLFRDHYKILCRFARGYIHDFESAEEIVQDVFVNLWQKKDTIIQERQVKSYLFTSVKNRCLNFIRDNKKFRSFYLDVEVELEIPVNEKDYFSEAYVENKVKQALNKLPEKCRKVFELSRFDEMKYKDVAETLGISIKTVEAQISKALKILKEELSDLLLIIIILGNLIR